MKKIIALLLACMMLVACTACAAKTEPAAPAQDASSEPAAAETAAAETPAAEETAAPATEAPAAEAAEAPAEEGPVMKKIKESGKLVVGTEAQYAPYEFKDLDANFAGCDMWLAQQIADALGVELEVVDMSFDGIIPAVQSSQVDIGIAAFTVTEERAQVIDFSEVYEKSPQAVIVKKGNEATYSTKESFAGQKVGAQKGTVQSLLIKNVLSDSELFELDKYPELGMEVAAGNIAALVVDSAVADALIKSNPELALAAFEFDPNEVNYGKAAVIAKGNEDFVAAVNEVRSPLTVPSRRHMTTR